MAIDYTHSLSYFNAHPKGHIWAQAGEPACTAAIAYARRQISRFMGTALNDAEAAYVEGDITRDEYAVYEQALWIIMNGVIANGEGSAPQAVLVADGADPGKPREPAGRIGLGPEALAWLGCSGRVMMSRG